MKIRVSVAMATYNGEKYLKEQIDSILKNLQKNDEIVISDDGSTDKTISIINSYNDSRIKLIPGPKKGIIQNFANAIENANGQYIFLSDQDDIWMDDKVEEIINTFKTKDCTVVVHDAVVVNENMDVIYDSYFDYRNSGKGILKNIYKNTYIGCCMAFKSDLKQKILPIPNDIEMHDQWIGIISDKFGKSFFLEKKLIKYRRHTGNNSSLKHHSIFKMIRNRIIFILRFIRRK